MPIFYVYMHNKIDPQDDEVYKFIAKSTAAAKKMAQRRDARGRFNVGKAMRAKDFRKRHPDWYSLISSWEASTTP